jgi:hypothetical protein
MITFNSLGSYGRLGNQMFQYAFVYSLAKNKNFDFGVPYKNKSKNEFNNFSIPEGFNITAQDSSGIDNKKIYKQKYFNYYEEIIYEIEDCTDIRGFYQSDKFFLDFKKEIKKEFTFKQKIIDKSDQIFKKYKEPLISICIRRGNYLEKPYSEHHPTIDLYYINQCLKSIESHKIIIITDDPNWNVLKKIKNSEIVKQSEDSDNKFVMMRLMSLCDYQIISNSSFCWWSAWLGDSKKIFAPKYWFHKKWFSNWKDDNWNDIYCDNWNVVDSNLKIYGS